jgi:hypothetical protein
MWIKDSYTTKLEGELNLERDAAEFAEQRARSASNTALYIEEASIRMEQELRAEIVKKDKLILEWMHTNAAFKKLAKDFADQLGIPKEERPQLVDQARLDVAEADPAFKHTDIYKDAVESLQKSKTKP